MEATETAKFRALLDEQREVLRRQLVDIGADPDDPNIETLGFDFGFADSAQSTAERSKVLAVIDSLRIGLADVDHALAQIEAGTYGLCERCDKPIEKARIKALPYATLCIEHAQAEGRR